MNQHLNFKRKSLKHSVKSLKIKYSIIGLFFLLPFTSNACDICGCGAGNNYIGILPDFHKHIIGVRYRYNSMFSHMGVGGTTTYLTTRERYNVAELWGGWNITDNFRVMGTIPYTINQRTNQDIRQTKSGIGDVNLSAFYQLLNKRNTVLDDRLLVQSLWIGGGVKLSTGKYNPADRNSTGESANLFQEGTGSNDFSVAAMYDLRLQDIGINLNSSYKMNTANKYDYQYGNKFNLSAQGYYKLRISENLLLSPNAGVLYEKGSADRDGNIKVAASGGNLLMGTIGLETGMGKVAIGANYQTPISQNLANGIVKANDRFMVHLAISL